MNAAYLESHRLLPIVPRMMGADVLERLLIQGRAWLEQREGDARRDRQGIVDAQPFLITGDAGTGKSHLLAILAARLAGLASAGLAPSPLWLDAGQFQAERVRKWLQGAPIDLPGATEGPLWVLIDDADDMLSALTPGVTADLCRLLGKHAHMRMVFTCRWARPMHVQGSEASGLWKNVLELHPPGEDLSVEHMERCWRLLVRLDAADGLINRATESIIHKMFRLFHLLVDGDLRASMLFLRAASCVDQSFSEAVRLVLEQYSPLLIAEWGGLSPQQRAILRSLSQQQGACQVKGLAKELGLSHQTVASQLKTLRERRLVVAHRLGRASYYEFRAPLHRMALQYARGEWASIRRNLSYCEPGADSPTGLLLWSEPAAGGGGSI